MSRWYRAYAGTVRDDKLAECAVIAGASRAVVIATWHAILESAADTGDGGRFETSPRRVAAILAEPVTVIDAVFRAMDEIGLIGNDLVTAWRKRQYESDNSTERSRKHREMKRNGDATAMQRCATPPDTEADTEADISSSLRSDDRRERPVSPPKASKPSTTQAPPPTPLPPDLIRDWQAVRKAKRAGPLSQTAWDGIAREAAKAGVTLETAVRTCVERGWQSFRADWLSDKRETRAPPRSGGNGYAQILREMRGAFDDDHIADNHEANGVFRVDFDEIGQDRRNPGAHRGQPSRVLDLTGFDPG